MLSVDEAWCFLHCASDWGFEAVSFFPLKNSVEHFSENFFFSPDYFLVSSKNIQLFFANWSGAAILFFLFLFSFSLILFHFFFFKVDVWKKISQLLKNLQLLCCYLGLFFFKTYFQDCIFSSWCCYLCRTSTPGESSNSSNSFQFVNSIALLWTDEHPDLKKYFVTIASFVNLCNTSSKVLSNLWSRQEPLVVSYQTLYAFICREGPSTNHTSHAWLQTPFGEVRGDFFQPALWVNN